MTHVVVAIAIAILAACTSGGPPTTKPKGPKLPAVDEKKAQRDASALVKEIYDTLGRGNKDSLYTLLDNELVVFGPRGADTLGTRADALTALGEIVDPKSKKQVDLRENSLEISPSPGGRSAWAFDIVNVNGEPIAIMAILTNIDDLWLVEAAALAHTPTSKTIKTEGKQDAVMPPGAKAAKKIDPAAGGAVDRFKKGLLDQDLWGADLTSRSDSIVIGPGFGEVTRGKKEIKKLWKTRVDAKTRAATNGEITARVTEDGQLAWVSAPVTQVAGEDEPLPLRAFAVFEKAGDSWKLIALHESVSIEEAGAAKSLKKILPPKPAEPKPEAEAEAKPDKKKVDKKKKKKKKKKKPSDDDE